MGSRQEGINIPDGKRNKLGKLRSIINASVACKKQSGRFDVSKQLKHRVTSLFLKTIMVRVYSHK